MSAIEPAASKVFHRELDRLYPVMVSASGNRLFDDEGTEYLDAVGGGAAVNNIGFGVPEVLRAAREQLGVLPFVHNQKFTTPLQEQLAEELLRHTPRFSRALFCQGGGEANETAMRLMRSYHVERGDARRWRVISVAQAYHGSTMATLALTGRPALQAPFATYLPEFPHIGLVDPRHDPDGARGLAELENAILEVGPETVAGFWCEPVSAAAAPALRAPDAFYAGLAGMRERYGFLVGFDEVVTGIGRTGTFLASDKLAVAPDIVTTAKGLGGGYVPFGAVLATEAVYESVAEGSRDFSHGYTFNGYPLGCAVALAVLGYIDEHHLVERVAEVGPRALEILKRRLHGCPYVDEVRGEGFLFGITYRDDGGAFLDPGLKFARRVDVAALDERLVVYSTQPTADGFAADQTMLAPAFITTEEDFEQIGSRLRRAIESAAADVSQGRPLQLVVG